MPTLHSRLTLAATAVGGLLAIAGPVAGDEPSGARFVGFADPVDLGLAGPPIDVVAGDIDGDGRLDLAAADGGSFGSIVTVWLGTAEGGFVAQSSQTLVPAGTSDLELVDLDGDGHLDLLVVDAGGGAIQVRWGTSGATFETSATVLPVSGGPLMVALGDADADGDWDCWTGNANGSISLLRNTGGRGFAAPQNLPIDGVPAAISSGDLDGDGDDDLVAAVPSAGLVRLVRSQPDGPAGGPTFVNGDATVDITAASIFGNPDRADIAGVTASGKVRVWRSNGNWSFVAPIEMLVDASDPSISAEDMDNDGDGDILVTDGGPAESVDRVVALVQDPDGFAEPMVVSENRAVRQFILADLDGNTSLDYVALVEDGEFRLVRTRINITDVLPPGPFDLAFPPDGTTGLPRPEDLVWEGATARLRWTPAAGFTVTYRVRIADNPFMDDPVLDLDGLTGVTFDVPMGTLSSAFSWYWTVEACTASGITGADIGVAGFTMTCREDLDGDGEIGLGDAVAVLSAWGQICGG